MSPPKKKVTFYELVFWVTVYFSPGLTSHIQPLDAGIIQCFKVHYQHEFCLCAVEKDANDEDDIYKIDLWEAMVMAKHVWSSISLAIIKKCWEHIGIQCPWLPTITLRPPCPPMLANLAVGWDIVVQYASNPWLPPEVHSFLPGAFRCPVHPQWMDWAPGHCLESWEWCWSCTCCTCCVAQKMGHWAWQSIWFVWVHNPWWTQQIEADLLALVDWLKVQRWITGQPLTLKELVHLKEWEIG